VITDEDLEAIGVETTRTINVDQFVPGAEIDDLQAPAWSARRREEAACTRHTA
jgi:hypothetical protein